MAKLWILVILTLLSTWIFQSVDSFRNDILQSPTTPFTTGGGGTSGNGNVNLAASRQAGCIWSTLESVNSNFPGNNSSLGKMIGNPPPTFMLSCNLRTLNVDFWNYTFNKAQTEQTSRVEIKCNDKLFFESFLTSNQSLFRLVNLKQLSIDSCKIRKMPGRIWGSLGFLKNLVIKSDNGEWSNSIGLEIEAGAFEGLVELETLDLSQNNIWSLPNNIFCPLKSPKFLKLNISHNRLTEWELSTSGTGRDLLSSIITTGGNDNNNNNGYCALSVQNLDLSFNTLRRVGSNAFSRMRKLTELRLQHNLIEVLEDLGLSGLTQLKLVNFSSNRIVALPPTIFKSNLALREINLSNNSISTLSPQVFSGLDSLLSLDLSRNMLSSQWIKDSFNGLFKLVILKLQSNTLTYVDDKIFNDLRSLKGLYLDNNRIERIHPQAFMSLTNLQILDLSRNRLSVIDPRTFNGLSALQDLGLSGNLFEEVPTAISRAGLGHLNTLDIGENRIGNITRDSFTGLENLYGLRFVDNKLTELPTSFCLPLKKLRVLNVAQNRINKISPSAFTGCPELRALRLDTNEIEELPQHLLSQLPSLLWLNASTNRIRYADYHLLPNTIEWLDLSFNALETLGGPTTSAQRSSESSSSSSSSTPFYHLRVLDASNNYLTHLDYTTIPPALEVLRVNNNRLKSVAPDTFIRAARLRRVELMRNNLENVPLASLRIPPVQSSKQLPEFYLGGNKFTCDCTMEWLTRFNQLQVLRTYPRIIDLDTLTCQLPHSTHLDLSMNLIDMKPSDFVCSYKSHCKPLCHCCDFDACDCEMTCPNNCTCYHDTIWSVNIVQCSNLDYTDVPSRIPMDATEIHLDGNNIPRLGSHTFIGKRNLKALFLNDSKVEFLQKSWTSNSLSSSLEILHLEDNLLTELQDEFADLQGLRELYLQNNIIRYIAEGTFAKLPFLERLFLNGNLIIDFNIWALSANAQLNSVMLSGNPWSCECEFLIPFRTWVASKASIVVDFTLANCQTVNDTHVLESNSGGSGGMSITMDETDSNNNNNRHHAIIPNADVRIQSSSSKLYPIQIQHPISSMCNQNPELNFNFNSMHNILESEIITNHISGGAEKVTIPHPSENEIQFAPVDSTNSDSNTFWTLVLTLTALIVLVLVIVMIFRKEIYYWIYTRVFANNNGLGRGGPNNNGTGCGVTFPFLFPSCCTGEKVGSKKSCGGGGDNGDDCDKLFDAYFIYSKSDEDILVQKIAPELESQQGPPYFRLCLHYRDLCLNPDNPWNTDMILSACDASKRVVLVLSRTFLQSELTHGTFRQAIQSAINRHQKKLILILLPPFSEQNLGTIYPELKNSSLKTSSLEWTDKNFWSKLKLILPTPSTMIGNNTQGRRGSSLLISSAPPPPLIDLHTGGGGGGSSTNSNASGTMSSYTINRLDFPYSSHHQYHRNILPYQIPVSNCSTLTSSGPNPNAPSVPKHHIALTTPFYNHHQSQPGQMNHYNGSQCSSSNGQYYISNGGGGGGGNQMQNFIHIPGRPSSGSGAVVYPMSTLPHPHPSQQQQQQQHFSFNESFRRHLQQKHQHLQQQYKGQTPVLQLVRQQNHQSGQPQQSYHNHPSNGTSYQPLEANYSSTSAISSSAEELEHVYSTLDSPLQSPNSANTTSTNVNNSLNSDASPRMLNETAKLNVSANNESANLSLVSPRSSYNNCSGIARANPSSNVNNSKRNSCRNNNLNEFPSQNSNNNNRPELPGQSNQNQGAGEGHGQPGNNGQMYFV